VYQNIAILSDIFIESLGNPRSGEFGRPELAFYFMNEWILLYIVIALSGALMSWYKVFIPVRNLFIKDGIEDHPYVKNYLMSSIVWTGLAAVLLPFIASALLFEDKTELFIKHSYEGAK
jgi:hypothetical protein